METDEKIETNQFKEVNQSLLLIVDELRKVDHYSNFEAVVLSIGRLSKELQLKLSDVEKAAKKELPELPAPNISVKAPQVKVDAPDVRGIEKLLSKELPKIVKQLTDSIPEAPETDLTRVEKLLDELGTIMAQVRDRKIPIPQMPTTLKITNPDGSLVGSTAAALVPGALTGQTAIAVTGTQLKLNGSVSQPLTNGLIITAPVSNSGPISIGKFNVNNLISGTGNGYLLAPGASVSFAVSNSNNIYINGTAGDYVSWAGS